MVFRGCDFCLLFLATLCTGVEYEIENGSGDHYDYDYYPVDNMEQSGDYYQDYVLETSEEDRALEVVPSLTSSPLQINIKPTQTATFPCQARDAERFVRVWLKDGDMLFTGTIRLSEDSRFSLTDKNTSLVLRNAGIDDSGTYACRIMMKESLTVAHNLTVADSLTIKSIPVEGVLSVPLNGGAEFGCTVIGEAVSPISWSRDNTRFRDGSYTLVGGAVSLVNVTLEDSGYYYCTTTDADGAVKAAQIHLQVVTPPYIVDVAGGSVRSGLGFLLEMTCTVRGHPAPKVIWYKDGEPLADSERMSSQQAGPTNVLILQNFQDSDRGLYMCYASNSLGTVQRIFKVDATHSEDINNNSSNHNNIYNYNNNNNIDLGEQSELIEELRQNILSLSQGRHQDHELIMRLKDQFDNIFTEKQNNNRSVLFSGVENSFDKAILSDLDRVEMSVRGMKVSFQNFQVAADSFYLKSEDGRQRIWDVMNELQEITNLTTRNIEEIYDKDILRLHNVQNSIESEIDKLKLDISGLFIGNKAERGWSGEVPQDIKVLQHSRLRINKDISALRDQNTEFQRSIRTELNMVFGDIDVLKKEKQDNALQIEQLKRYLSTMEVEQVEENGANIQAMRTLLSHLDSRVDKTIQRLRKFSQQSTENEKINILVEEVQKLKNQAFYLQQTIIQLKSTSQGSQSVVVEDSTSGSPIADLVVRVEQQAQEITSWEQRVEQQTQEIASWEQRFEKVQAENIRAREQQAEIIKQLKKIEDKVESREKETRKYYLVLSGLSSKRTVERPLHVRGLVANFVRAGLKLKDVVVDEAVRLTEGLHGRPVVGGVHPIRVKFSSMRDRELVLRTARAMKTRVRVAEYFTDKVRQNRQKLVQFARSTQSRSKWVLKEDRLYMNQKVYMYNSTIDAMALVGNNA